MTFLCPMTFFPKRHTSSHFLLDERLPDWYHMLRRNICQGPNISDKPVKLSISIVELHELVIFQSFEDASLSMKITGHNHSLVESSTKGSHEFFFKVSHYLP
jgi:hypothetical protein